MFGLQQTYKCWIINYYMARVHLLAACHPWKGLSIYLLANYTQRIWKLQPIEKVLLHSVLGNWFPCNSCSVKYFILQNVIQNKKHGTHRLPLISSCTSKRAGRIWAGSNQAVCKEIHCSKVSFSTFSAVVTRVPGFKGLNSLLCLLHNLQNSKQRATRKEQILPLSTPTCPLPQKSLSSGSLL